MPSDKPSIGFQATAPVSEKEREKLFQREFKKEFTPEFIGRINYPTCYQNGKRTGAPVIETMLQLLSECEYPELTQFQMQKLASFIHHQHLSSSGIR